MRGILLIGAVTLAGCAHWYNQPAPDFAGRSTYQICSGYHYSENPQAQSAFRAELERRRLVEPGEWRLINSQKVAVGMTECGMLAAWGFAESTTLTTGRDTHTQWAFKPACPSLAYCPPWAYVYTSNGRVTAIQQNP